MILSGEEIKKEIRWGGIKIDPYEEANVQPASIDLRLGDQVRVYKDQAVRVGGRFFYDSKAVIDPKKEQATLELTMPSCGFELAPGILYLMHTLERVHTDQFVSVLDGKSSIGRLGVIVHLTAGYGDPGFDGQYTLEVTCVHPVKLYPGMKIAQMRFHLIGGTVTSYKNKGHYVGDGAKGAIASKAYLQFEDTSEKRKDLGDSTP